MPYHSMAPDEVRAFLTATPAQPGILATVRPDGRPHAVPIWYDVDDDGSIVFNTGESTVKGRNLRHQARATLCVQDPAPPYSFVLIEGPVTISEDLGEVRGWAARLGGRYMGAERAEEFGARNGVPGELLVRLIPEKIVSAVDLAD
jgi:PPOX class probable F420-dependent enzyme